MRHSTGSHLRMTRSVLAKQRRRAGAQAEPDGSFAGRVGRVQNIDALLLAMQRRLGAVKAAMAEDALRQQQQERAREQLATAMAGAAGAQASGVARQQDAPSAVSGAAAVAGSPPAIGATPCTNDTPPPQPHQPAFARKLLAEAAAGALVAAGVAAAQL